MGEVYEAEHVRLGKKVAVKIMAADAAADARALQRFRRETLALSAIASEHVVTVFDCGEVDGEIPYIVMERLQGEDVRRLIARHGPISTRRAVRFARDACAGLAAIHAAGLVHRDLKPANLFITSSDARGEHCKILDLGVAKALASDATAQGSLLGTVRYMAPEQLSDSASVTAAADVYAVGAILFECLTGRPAYDAETPQELMFKVLNEDPPSVVDLRGDVPQELADIIGHAMSRKARDRYQDVAELSAALAGAMPDAHGSDETTQDGSQFDGVVAARPPPRRRQRPALFVLLALLGGLLLGVGISSFARSGTSGTANFSSAPIATAVAKESPRTATTATPASSRSTSDSIPNFPAGSTETFKTDRPTAAVRTQRAEPAVSPRKAATSPVPVAAPKATARPEAVLLDVKNPYDE